MEDTILHCPAMPVYTQLAPVNGVVHIGVPDDKSELSRRDKALLVVAIKHGEIDLRDWSVADLAKLLNASPRSVSEAMRLSRQEQQNIAAGRRPLFLHQPCFLTTPTEHLKLAINGLGIEGVLAALALAESEATTKVAT